MPGTDSRHEKWAKKLFHQNHHSVCKKTKRHCMHVLPLSDHTRRNFGIPDSFCYTVLTYKDMMTMIHIEDMSMNGGQMMAHLEV